MRRLNAELAEHAEKSLGSSLRSLRSSVRLQADRGGKPTQPMPSGVSRERTRRVGAHPAVSTLSGKSMQPMPSGVSREGTRRVGAHPAVPTLSGKSMQPMPSGVSREGTGGGGGAPPQSK